MVENAYEGIIVTQEGFVKFANARAAALSGRALEDTYTTPFPEMIHPEDRPRVYQNYLRRMRAIFNRRQSAASVEKRNPPCGGFQFGWETRIRT